MPNKCFYCKKEVDRPGFICSSCYKKMKELQVTELSTKNQVRDVTTKAISHSNTVTSQNGNKVGSYKKKPLTIKYVKTPATRDRGGWAPAETGKRISFTMVEKGKPIVDDYTGKYLDTAYFDDEITGVV